MRFDQVLTMVDAAIQGLGVGLGHSNLVAADLASKRLVRPFDFELPAEFAYYVAYPCGHELKPCALAFRDWLLEYAET